MPGSGAAGSDVFETTRQPSKWSGLEWPVWACLLVALYLGVGLVGWDRTLIPDEIRPLLMTSRSLGELLEFARLDLVQTPLSYLLARAWLDLFGHTDAAAKALALLVNALTLVLFTLLARRVTVHWRLAALLLCIAYLRIGSAPNLVRMYGLAVLLSVVAILLWDQWRKRPTTRALASWAGAMALLFYTHGSGLLLLPAFVVANWLHGPRRWAFTVAALASLLALGPWILSVLPVFLARGIEANVSSLRMSPHTALSELPFYFLSTEDPGGWSPRPPLHRSELKEPLVQAAIWVHVALLALAWPRREGLWRRGADDDWLGVGLLLCLIPMAVLYGFSVLSTPAIHARYLLVTLPAYCLVLVLLGHSRGLASRCILFGVVLPWSLVNSGWTVAEHVASSPVGKGVELVARQNRGSDLVLIDKHMPLGWQVVWEWTRGQGRTDPVHILPSPMPDYLSAIAPATLPRDLQLENVERVWLFHRNRKRMRWVTGVLGTQGFLIGKMRVGELDFLTLFSRASPHEPTRQPLRRREPE